MQLPRLFNFEPGSLLMAQAYMLIDTLSNVGYCSLEPGDVVTVLAVAPNEPGRPVWFVSGDQIIIDCDKGWADPQSRYQHFQVLCP